jgi:hypothetical protein
LTLDLAIGETSAIESEDKGKIQDIVRKVKDLNGRLQDIRREQVFQRVSRHICWISDVQLSSDEAAINRIFMISKLTSQLYRSGRPSSEISLSLQMRELCDGH